ISREWREYERSSTAVLSAYVQPVAERYLGQLADKLREAGFGGQFYIMQSNCGVDSVEKTQEIPITMVESGPASGFWGAAELGRVNPDYFGGGEIRADMDAVERALDAIAEKLDVDRAESARGIVRIANNNMINALKLVSVNRGYDPREFTLVAFGGGGGMHAVALARELGIHKVVIPRADDVFSAWGMLMSNLRRDYFVTRLTTLNADNAPRLDDLLD